MKNYIAALILGVLGTYSAAGQGLAITQIDTDRLLFGQTVRLYLSAPPTLESGDALPEIEIWEAGEDSVYSRRPVKAVSRDRNVQEGISFFFLLDNSGSMWTDLEGNEGAAEADLRIGHAKAAARTFLAEVSRKDTVGLGVFNTRYWHAADPTGNLELIDRSLEELRKPAAEDAFTELYLSLERAIADFARIGGRRVLVVLSDGENYTYYGRTGKENPETGTRVTSPAEALEAAIREGITVYVVRFGKEKDPSLGAVALGSGGKVFDAADKEELFAVYATIREDVLRELSVDYTAGMQAGSRRTVKAVLRGGSGAAQVSERYYYSGTLFGWNKDLPPWYYLVLPAAAVLLWLALLFFKLERETDRAGLRLLYGGKGAGTRVFNLNAPATVIGSSAAADVTLAGNASLRGRHATILYDQERHAYTVVADEGLTVNNREVKRRRLEAGDVINMAGTVVVFEDTLPRK